MVLDELNLLLNRLSILVMQSNLGNISELIRSFKGNLNLVVHSLFSVIFSVFLVALPKKLFINVIGIEQGNRHKHYTEYYNI